jgi:hypothetical protein
VSAFLIAWLISLPPVLLVGFSFGFASGRERERRRYLGRKRTCTNCRGWGHIRIGLPLIGMTWPCCDCHGFGYHRARADALRVKT